MSTALDYAVRGSESDSFFGEVPFFHGKTSDIDVAPLLDLSPTYALSVDIETEGSVCWTSDFGFSLPSMGYTLATAGLNTTGSWIEYPEYYIQRDHPPVSFIFESGVESGVFTYIKSTEELSQPAKRALGSHGVGRFERFKELLDGWDGSFARKMSYTSVGVLNYFFNILSDYFIDVEPSIFLNRSGNLSIAWERAECDYEVDFLQNGFDVFLSVNDSEFFVEFNNINELISLVNI